MGSLRRAGVRGRTLRGVAAGVCAVIGMVMFAGGAAGANFPHFRSFSVSLAGTETALARQADADAAALPDLRISWTEVGLGSADVSYRASTLVSATYGCVNGGSNRPPAANKVTVAAPAGASVVLGSDRNGRINGTLDLDTAGVGPGGFSCPPGQVLTAVAVTFSRITLTDVTNDVSVTADDISVVLP